MNQSPGPAEGQIKTLIYRNFLSSALVPIFTIELVLLCLYFGINTFISHRNSNTLLEEATANVSEIAAQQVLGIDGQLQEVARLATIMQREHQAYFATEAAGTGPCPLHKGSPQFALHANGAYFKSRPNGGASLYYSGGTPIGAAEARKALCTESMDPLLESIVETSPVVTQAYINTWDGMNRLYPPITDVAVQYGASITMQDFNFYFLADAAHNPERKPVWTSAYLDPAGQGRMVSVIVPVYRGDFLEAVSGLDVTIKSFVGNILSLKMPWDARSLMVDNKGMILALQPGVASFLAIDDVDAYANDVLLGRGEAVDTVGAEPVAAALPLAQLARVFREGRRIDRITVGALEYLVSQETVPTTGWRLLTLIQTEHVLAPIEDVELLGQKLGFGAILLMALFYAGMFRYLQRKSLRLAAFISEPIEKLSAATRDLGRSAVATALQRTGITELDALGTNFNTMARELETRNQSLLAARNAAEAASRAKSRFLASMSHELRTPMNAILGTAELLQAEPGDPLRKSQLARIVEGSRRLLAQLNAILDFSNLESDRVVLGEARFRLADCLQQIRAVLVPRAQAKHLALETSLPDAIARMWLRGDSRRLEQVLLNLSDNALKFTQRGSICVSVALQDHGPTDVLLHFAVTDTGPGLSEEAQDLIFMPFEKGDGTLTHQLGGAGLALVSSRRLVELMGGYLGCHSVPGEGSTFWFTARFSKCDEPVIDVIELSVETSVAELIPVDAAVTIEAEPLSVDILQGIVSHLRQLLEREDFAALSFVADNERVLRAGLGEGYERLHESVAVFEFGAALGVLDANKEFGV